MDQVCCFFWGGGGGMLGVGIITRGLVAPCVVVEYVLAAADCILIFFHHHPPDKLDWGTPSFGVAEQLLFEGVVFTWLTTGYNIGSGK